ncbi:OLC1v1012808C1 [Oldenlandia corymbosa var. corymbosa]|uniref:OLC1v1012808C1 n=1 Tax=Oldenlandia corymbosa var. corymbosa TaxID=529605 RepID=A0AAV1E0C2_OLDCO|nr:OLC1v1012808C1 [Oldenlandia corymbosa var. corymbosa]
MFLIFIISFSKVLQVVDSAELTSSHHSPYYVALSQLEFWYRNVNNPIPEVIASNLSPLSNGDSDALFASFTSPNNDEESYSSIPSAAKLCSMANLASTPLQEISFQSPKEKLSYPFPFFYDLFAIQAVKEGVELSTQMCGIKDGIHGEIKACLNSLEGLIHFAKETLETKTTKVTLLTTENTLGLGGKELEIGNIKPFFHEHHNSGHEHQKVVTCHELWFPFATYFCHSLPTTHHYTVDLVEPVMKAHVNRVLVMCHMDTSEWLAVHEAFRQLNMSLGERPICHWMTRRDLPWIASPATVHQDM